MAYYLKIKKIEVWAIPKTTAEFLRFLVTLNGSKTILELGTSIGYSTLWLALGAKETKGHVYTTEIFKPKADIAKKHFKQAKLNKNITLIEKKNLEVLKDWSYSKIDFVFLDADKQKYKQYLKLLLPILSKNGVIVADNAGNYSKYMKDFLRECKRLKYQVYFLSIDNGLMIINKSSKVNFLHDFKKTLPKLLRNIIFSK